MNDMDSSENEVKPNSSTQNKQQKADDLKKTKTTDENNIEEPSSIFRKRRKWMLNDNLLVSREESERRLQNGYLCSAFLLVIVCSLMTSLYYQAFKIDLPTIITPMRREEPDPCKYFSKH